MLTIFTVLALFNYFLEIINPQDALKVWSIIDHMGLAHVCHVDVYLCYGRYLILLCL